MRGFVLQTSCRWPDAEPLVAAFILCWGETSLAFPIPHDASGLWRSGWSSNMWDMDEHLCPRRLSGETSISLSEGPQTHAGLAAAILALLLESGLGRQKPSAVIRLDDPSSAPPRWWMTRPSREPRSPCPAHRLVPLPDSNLLKEQRTEPLRTRAGLLHHPPPPPALSSLPLCWTFIKTSKRFDPSLMSDWWGVSGSRGAQFVASHLMTSQDVFWFKGDLSGERRPVG